MWKEQFKNLLGKSPKFTDNPITKIINNRLDIKQGEFSQEDLNVVQIKSKIEKLPVLMKYPQKYQRKVNSMTYYFDTAPPFIRRIQ